MQILSAAAFFLPLTDAATSSDIEPINNERPPQPGDVLRSPVAKKADTFADAIEDALVAAAAAPPNLMVVPSDPNIPGVLASEEHDMQSLGAFVPDSTGANVGSLTLPGHVSSADWMSPASQPFASTSVEGAPILSTSESKPPHVAAGLAGIDFSREAALDLTATIQVPDNPASAQIKDVPAAVLQEALSSSDSAASQPTQTQVPLETKPPAIEAFGDGDLPLAHGPARALEGTHEASSEASAPRHEGLPLHETAAPLLAPRSASPKNQEQLASSLELPDRSESLPPSIPADHGRVSSLASANALQPVQHSATIADQIKDAIVARLSESATPGRTEIHVQLHPPELGRVRVHLVTQDNHVSGRLVVQQEGVRAVLESQLPELRQRLEDAGVTLGRFDVAQDRGGHAGNAFHRPAPFGESSDSLSREPVRVLPPNTARSPSRRGLIDLLA